MGSALPFAPERLLVALLSSRLSDCQAAALETALEEGFGPVDWRGPVLDFPWTNYYEAEMGQGLRRSFLSFSRLVDPSTFADIKTRTNAIEARFATEGRRLFNLDPGLLSLGRFVLATTKDRAHRIPLASGIYAELTLYFEKGQFRGLPWTYPDWASEEYRRALAELRLILKSQLKQGELPPA
jgi:hypothetical protein